MIATHTVKTRQSFQPTTSSALARPSLLQRKCACGGLIGPGGECEKCKQARGSQPELRNEPGNEFEQEASIMPGLRRSQEQPLQSDLGRSTRSELGHEFSQIKTGDAGTPISPIDRSGGGRPPGSKVEGHAASYRREIPLLLPLDIREGRRTTALDYIVSNLGPGRPLPSSMKASAPGLATHRLGTIRLHDDPRSQATADLLHSQAFTVGNHIVLGSSVPKGDAGRDWLLAHELAHSVQQTTPATAGQPQTDLLEAEADRFADFGTSPTKDASRAHPTLTPASIGLARKVIWRHIQDLPYDLLLILDVDDGDFVGGCVKAIVPHVGVKLIKKYPHAQLFNLHVGFLTNAKGEFCIFFYESVSGICELLCFPSKQKLRENWDKVKEWLREMIKKLLMALGVLALIAAALILAYLIAQAIAAALLVLLAA